MGASVQRSFNGSIVDFYYKNCLILNWRLCFSKIYLASNEKFIEFNQKYECFYEIYSISYFNVIIFFSVKYQALSWSRTRKLVADLSAPSGVFLLGLSTFPWWKLCDNRYHDQNKRLLITIFNCC